MNIETLIAMVYERPPLWDKKNKLRGDRNVIDKFWRQISIEMKEDGKCYHPLSFSLTN